MPSTLGIPKSKEPVLASESWVPGPGPTQGEESRIEWMLEQKIRCVQKYIHNIELPPFACWAWNPDLVRGRQVLHLLSHIPSPQSIFKSPVQSHLVPSRCCATSTTISRTVSSFQTNSAPTKQELPTPTYLQLWQPLTFCLNLPKNLLRTPRQWTHTIPVLLWLVYFTTSSGLIYAMTRVRSSFLSKAE